MHRHAAQHGREQRGQEQDPQAPQQQHPQPQQQQQRQQQQQEEQHQRHQREQQERQQQRHRQQQQEEQQRQEQQERQHALELWLEELGTGTCFHVLLGASLALVWAGDAAEVMVLGVLGPAAACAFGLAGTAQALLASVVFGGMVAGGAAWGLAADRFGRRPALLASAGCVVVAGLASAAAPTPALLLVSRAAVGFGLAGAPVAFTLMMELLPDASRATWGTTLELAWTAGTVAEAALAWALLPDWRLLLVVSALPLALVLLMGRCLPESPRFLLSRGDMAGAAHALRSITRLAGRSAAKLPPLPAALLPPGGDGLADAALQPAHEEQQRLLPQAVRQPGGEQEQQLQPGAPATRQAHGSMAGTSSSSASGGSASRSSSSTQRPTCPAAALPPAREGRRSFEQQAAAPAGAPLQPQQQQHQPRPGQGLCDALAALVQPGQARATLSLLGAWAATAFAYYGLVQLSAELHLQAGGAAAAGSGGPVCVDGMLQVPDSDFAAVLATSGAEVPAIAWAMLSARWLGSRAALAVSLLLTAGCLLPSICLAAAGGGWAGAAAQEAAGGGGGSLGPWAGAVTDACMFGSRLSVASAFALLWVVTPARYSTRTRALGLGLSNASARLGGAASPFAALNLTAAAGHNPAAAEGVFAVACLAAAAAVLLLPHAGAAAEGLDDADGGGEG